MYMYGTIKREDMDTVGPSSGVIEVGVSFYRWNNDSSVFKKKTQK